MPGLSNNLRSKKKRHSIAALVVSNDPNDRVRLFELSVGVRPQSRATDSKSKGD